MSSGMTWVRPDNNASARAALTKAIVARGLAVLDEPGDLAGQNLIGCAGHGDSSLA